jgi:hypothetical protein
MEVDINNIKYTFLSILDDYKKYYININKNPDSSEFQSYYSNTKSQIDKLNNNLIQLNRTMESKIIELNKENTYKLNKLNTEKKKIKELEELLNYLQSSGNGSQKLIYDTKVKYNYQYYNNIELLLGIIIVILLVIKNK